MNHRLGCVATHWEIQSRTSEMVSVKVLKWMPNELDSSRIQADIQKNSTCMSVLEVGKYLETFLFSALWNKWPQKRRKVIAIDLSDFPTVVANMIQLGPEQNDPPGECYRQLRQCYFTYNRKKTVIAFNFNGHYISFKSMPLQDLVSSEKASEIP